MTVLSENLRKYIKQAKINNQQLASKLGKPPNTVSRWTTGRFAPRRSELPAIAKALNVPELALVGKTPVAAQSSNKITFSVPAQSYIEITGDKLKVISDDEVIFQATIAK